MKKKVILKKERMSLRLNIGGDYYFLMKDNPLEVEEGELKKLERQLGPFSDFIEVVDVDEREGENEGVENEGVEKENGEVKSVKRGRKKVS